MPAMRAFLVLLTCVASISASDWPQWRGLHRDGLSPETGLLAKWPENGPPLLWESKGAGRGYSSMSSAGGRVYTAGDNLSTENSEDEYIVCFDGANGKLIWKAKLGQPYTHSNKQWESSRSTPTIDGDRLYFLTGNGEIICLKTANGQEVWRKSLPDDFGGKKGDGWGFSESVLIEGNKAICTPGGKTTMAALDKLTGKVIWTATLPDEPGAGHASIVMSELGGTRVCVQTTQGFGLGVRANDGKILWTVSSIKATAVIPTPIVDGDLVLMGAGYNLGSTLLRQVPHGDGIDVETVYPLNRTLANKHGGMVRIGEYVYCDKEDSGMPGCVEFKTGKQMWRERGKGTGSMSVIAADGHLYLHFADGTIILAKATPNAYEPISTFKVPHAGIQPGWAHMMLADGKLYLRGEDYIRCYDVMAK
jgi:outer membrane protein assembly factor BamB